ncbi:helix-turn-helix domain-containing protein [Pedobacter aquae]|nr:helix-turn-helix domain-containing protein [Pedobacter aquae]QEK50941.1 helix-turn-helix domain-containing protein [Pedobacter aquae]
MTKFFKLINILLNVETLLQQILTTLNKQQELEQEEEWMDAYEVRDFFKIHRSTLYRWQCEKIIEPSRMGRKNMYRKSHIQRILEQSHRDT